MIKIEKTENTLNKISKCHPDLIKGPKHLYCFASDIDTSQIPENILNKGMKICMEKDHAPLLNILYATFEEQYEGENYEWYFDVDMRDITVIHSQSGRFKSAIKVITTLTVSGYRLDGSGYGKKMPDFHLAQGDLSANIITDLKNIEVA